MEVLAHSHTSRKKWTHYLWEFLMLFLAVFCGFLAENIREHKVEQQRAKEFARSLVQDLQNDTTAIKVQKKSGGIYIAIADSLLNLSKTRLEDRNAAEFSFYTRFMYWTVPLSWNRATFQQIKNSGSLRYFKDYQLLEKLMKYDALVNEIEGEFNNHQTRGNMLLKTINEIIDPGFHHDISKYRLLSLDTMSKETRENYLALNIESLENKRGQIREMLNMIVVQQRNILFNEGRLERAEELAVELISDSKRIPPEINFMEVHAHTHASDPDSHRGRKNWTHYFWEFLMLFLAVFCGFLAEYKLEHVIEHQREKEYAKALYEEFMADSVSFSNKISARLEKEKDCDYLWSYIKDSSLTNLPKLFYPAYTTVFYLINSYSFEPKDGVLSQLKSSGSLRYFKNATLQKLFGDISVAINNVRYRNEQEYQFFASPIKLFMLKHYDFKWPDELRKKDQNAYYLDLIREYRKGDAVIKATILNLDSFDRGEATNMIMFYKTMLASSRSLQMNDYIKVNTKILQELRRNYKLK